MRVRPLIHRVDPYIALDMAGHVADLQGWGHEHPIFARLLGELRPRFILEVGTWKGASAVHMGRLQRQLGISDGEIVCVDTWLGALEFWTNHDDPTRYRSLNLTHGFPSVYYTFLKNVVAEAMSGVITPFPTTSGIAARFFKLHTLNFDLVYLDASHDYEDVAADIAAYWPLVGAGGVLFGDDFTQGWPGVMRAVNEFAEQAGMKLQIDGDKWVMRRQPAAAVTAAPAAASTETRLAAADIDWTANEWRFTRSTGFVVASKLRLAADGTIQGYRHANEARWAVEGEALVFLSAAGATSTRFSAFARGPDGKVTARGPFLFLPSAFEHVLSEV